MVTAATFRELALALPEACEGAHQGNADFRLQGRVFASLHPGDATGMVILPPLRQQELLARGAVGVRPATGAWGRQGCTLLDLAALDVDVLGALLTEAWQHLQAKLAAKRGKK